MGQVTSQDKPHPKWDKLVRAIRGRQEPIADRLAKLKGEPAGAFVVTVRLIPERRTT